MPVMGTFVGMLGSPKGGAGWTSEDDKDFDKYWDEKMKRLGLEDSPEFKVFQVVEIFLFMLIVLAGIFGIAKLVAG